uniref:branched-chain amino acid ABC transporter permease n=1 Tax=Thioclava electrotropha TaxID=1549850 RepID=UPI0023A8A86A
RCHCLSRSMARFFEPYINAKKFPGGTGILGSARPGSPQPNENENRATSLGYSVARYKLAAFVMSATLAGLAGAMKALVFQFASLTDAHWQMSGEVILMTLLGGMGTIFGPVVGAFIVVTLQHFLSGIGSWVQVVIGGTFIACVLLFRRGIVGEIARLLRISSL